MTLAPGARLGDYRILAPVGTGAYGEVFQAEHIITQRIDALKIQTQGHPRDAGEEQRFLREIQVQAALDHPNIAAVHNAFWTPHGLVLVMELVPGEPLSAILARARVPLRTGIRYILGMLAGLGYAHAHGVVHRDIKPENIVVTPDGSVKLTDFGLARSVSSPRLTQTGQFAGSPCYMSPEQVLGNTLVDVRTDIYSTGVVLYEIATGRPPFVGENGFAVMSAHQSLAPTPPVEVEPAIGEALSGVILKALEKDPSQRYQGAAEFHQAIEQAFPPARPVPAKRGVVAAVMDPRQRPLLVLAGVAATVFSAALFVTLFSSGSDRPAAGRMHYTSRPLIFIPPEPVPAAAPASTPAADPQSTSESVESPQSPPQVARPARRTTRTGGQPSSSLPSAMLGLDVRPGSEPRSSPPSAAPAQVSPQTLERADRSSAPIAPPEMAPPLPDPAALAPAPGMVESPDSPPQKKPHVVWRTLRKVLRLPRGSSNPPAAQP